jgi:hypothetical protein
MRELQQKQKAKQRLYSLPVVVVLGIVTFLVINGAYSVLMKRQESSVYVKELETKVELLNIREAEVRANILRLQTDEGINAEIKKKFSVTMEGEKVVVIVDPKVETPTVSTTTEPWYKRIKRMFSSLW